MRGGCRKCTGRTGTSRWWLVRVSPTYRDLIWIGGAVHRAPLAQPLSDFSISVLPSGTVKRCWTLLTSAPQLQAHSICQNISYDHMVRLILLWMLHQYTCFYREQQSRAVPDWKVQLLNSNALLGERRQQDYSKWLVKKKYLIIETVIAVSKCGAPYNLRWIIKGNFYSVSMAWVRAVRPGCWTVLL